MKNGLSYINEVVQLARTIKSTIIDIDDKENSLAVRNLISSGFEKMFEVRDALWTVECFPTFGFVRYAAQKGTELREK